MTEQFRGSVNSRASFSPFFSGGVEDDPSRESWDQYAQTFGRYGRESREFSEEEKRRRDRARKANRIYKQACEDVGLKSCFFDNFGVWSRYVEGKMSDDEFRVNAVAKAREMAAANN